MPKTTLGTERLGMTDLEVSPIAFGTWQLGGEWGSSTRTRESRRSARRASSASTSSTPRRATASAPLSGCSAGRFATTSTTAAKRW